ncbi:MAG: hypothetical protein ABII97_02755 [Patescibacteria group bacterium]
MSSQIVYKEKDEEKFWKLWENFTNQNLAGQFYLKTSLEYDLLLSQNNSLLKKDKSFVYLEDGETKGCVFLPIEDNENFISVSINRDYAYFPIAKSNRVEKIIFNLIDKIASENNVSKVMFFADPASRACPDYNILQKYNYIDSSILTHVIDLCKSDNLLSECRKGHRHVIKKMQRNEDFKIHIMDKNNPEYSIHEEYRKLHRLCSGRITRPKETFDIQFKKLEEGNAILVGLKYKNKYVAFSYFDFNANSAVYANGADNPKYDHLPLYHIILFSAMEYLKKNNVRYLNVLQPANPSQQFDYYPDKKQLNIALFKRGFGGDYKTTFRGVKYFSKKILTKDFNNFINKYELENEK